MLSLSLIHIYYATVCFSNTGDRVIAVPWMSNWQYANIIPTQQYRSANALPRELTMYSEGKEVYLSLIHILISLNAEIEEVTASKLQFFTNISHEVRTPLTLILGPLDRLLNLLHDSPYLSDLELIHKNAGRLLRVINQLLDFRKVENKQEKLKIPETEIVSFSSEVKSYFKSMANVRNITSVSDTHLDVYKRQVFGCSYL